MPPNPKFSTRQQLEQQEQQEQCYNKMDPQKEFEISMQIMTSLAMSGIGPDAVETKKSTKNKNNSDMTVNSKEKQRPSLHSFELSQRFKIDFPTAEEIPTESKLRERYQPRPSSTTTTRTTSSSRRSRSPKISRRQKLKKSSSGTHLHGQNNSTNHSTKMRPTLDSTFATKAQSFNSLDTAKSSYSERVMMDRSEATLSPWLPPNRSFRENNDTTFAPSRSCGDIRQARRRADIDAMIQEQRNGTFKTKKQPNNVNATFSEYGTLNEQPSMMTLGRQHPHAILKNVVPTLPMRGVKPFIKNDKSSFRKLKIPPAATTTSSNSNNGLRRTSNNSLRRTGSNNSLRRTGSNNSVTGITEDLTFQVLDFDTGNQSFSETISQVGSKLNSLKDKCKDRFNDSTISASSWFGRSSSHRALSAMCDKADNSDGSGHDDGDEGEEWAM